MAQGQPRALVLSGYGLNCEDETKFAFEQAGARVEIVHLNDLIAAPEKLKDYEILALPGGFSYGDDTGSGNAFANRLSHHLAEPLQQFVQRGTLTVGICNGFQIISNLGLVPALARNYDQPLVVLRSNAAGRYSDRWVDLRVDNKSSPWLEGMRGLSLPIAHGEGRLVADSVVLAELKRRGLVALRYVSGEMCEYGDLPANPNGSSDDIAGITDETGRVLGLMPHPERAISSIQQPNWPLVSDGLRRRGELVPEVGPGLAIFQNAVRYFQ